MLEKVYKRISVLIFSLLGVGCVINMIYTAVRYHTTLGAHTGFPLGYILLGVLLNWLMLTAIGVVIYFSGLFIVRKIFAK